MNLLVVTTKSGKYHRHSTSSVGIASTIESEHRDTNKVAWIAATSETSFPQFPLSEFMTKIEHSRAE